MGTMREENGIVAALGMFDGMHLGHRTLIARACALAEQTGAAPAVYTFENHPMEVLGGQVMLLSAPDERRADMRALGISDVRMERFTRALADLTPETFVGRLCAMWKLRGVVVGFNYTFGAHGLGTPETLKRLGAAGGFATEVVGPVLYRDEPVSSTRIRACIEAGDVEQAAHMLTHPYRLEGTVVENRKIGRRIGFPTANIHPPEKRVLPQNGVYATDVLVDGATLRAVTNVGTNPTVGGDALHVESHLLDFSGDLYGKSLTVSFLKMLRGEQKFASVAELQSQIARDAEAAARVRRRA